MNIDVWGDLGYRPGPITSRETEVEHVDTGCVMHTRELEWGCPLAYLVLNSIVKLYVGRKL